MDLFWFLLGLVVGLGLLGWYHFQLSLKLKSLIRGFMPDALKLSLKPASTLSRAIAIYGRQCHELSQELENWRQIFQAAPIGFIQVDDDNHLLLCNPAACQLLGIQISQSSQPRLLLELVRSYELDQLIEQARFLRKACQQEWVFHPVFADPSQFAKQPPRPIRGYAFPLHDRAVVVFLENRQEAILLEQQRDRWISDVAHELKTPLTSIRLVAETIQPRLEPPLKEWVDRLLQETIRLSNLVQDLLDLSQLESQSCLQLSRRTVDLQKLIQSTWLSLEPLARRKQIGFEYRGPSELLIQADESRLHRALLNLLDNGIKYSPLQQIIRVQVSLMAMVDQESLQQVCLEVIDYGPGFPESALPHVFERFYRADPSRTRSNAGVERAIAQRGMDGSAKPPGAEDEERTLPASSGSGLGLAIVRQIVEAHGGSVKASNHPETGGAWLQVFIPV